MNYFKSMIAYLHESQVAEKGRTASEAKFGVTVLLAVVLLFNLFLGFMLFYFFNENDEFMQWFNFLEENRFGYKMMIWFTIAIFVGLIFLLLRPKYYNSILSAYYNLSNVEQSKSDKKGKLFVMILFVLPVIGIFIFLFNFK
jgi:hypothetical protein